MGFTTPELDKTFKKYAQKNLDRYLSNGYSYEEAMSQLEHIAYKKFKSIQYKIECVNNAGGQTPFVTWTFGTDTSELGKLISRAILKVRENHMAIFPKLVYLYSSNISGEGKPNKDLYEYAKRVSIKRMYPDFVSADKGYMKEVYDRCGTIISPMGELLLI